MTRERILVLRAQSGDRIAFDELLRGIERPPHADDVLQDTFIAIVRNIVWLEDPALFRA
jgi:DNA-directed RNA polymerase specialized sigma24 family protein